MNFSEVTLIQNLLGHPVFCKVRDNNLLFYICFRHHYQILLLLPWKFLLLWVSEKSAFLLEIGTGWATSKEHKRLELRVCSSTIRRP